MAVVDACKPIVTKPLEPGWEAWVKDLEVRANDFVKMYKVKKKEDAKQLSRS
jgi:hypothetical protein